MAQIHKGKIAYRCNPKIWKKIKLIENRDNYKDQHLLLDRLLKRGIEVYENERQSKGN